MSSVMNALHSLADLGNVCSFPTCYLVLVRAPVSGVPQLLTTCGAENKTLDPLLSPR